jgi:hypothetical protein
MLAAHSTTPKGTAEGIADELEKVATKAIRKERRHNRHSWRAEIEDMIEDETPTDDKGMFEGLSRRVFTLEEERKAESMAGSLQ